MQSVPGYYFEYLAFGAFWCFVIGLDLVCLWGLRRSRIDSVARFLWMVWIVAVPIVGAITYFIVQPTTDLGNMVGDDRPLETTGTQRPHWNDNIQR